MIAAQEVKKASAQKDVEPASGDVEQVALAKPVEADTLKIDGKRFNLGMSEGATKVGLQAALAPQATKQAAAVAKLEAKTGANPNVGEKRISAAEAIIIAVLVVYLLDFLILALCAPYSYYHYHHHGVRWYPIGQWHTGYWGRSGSVVVVPRPVYRRF